MRAVGCTATMVSVIDLKIVLKEKQKINKINTLRHLFERSKRMISMCQNLGDSKIVKKTTP